jgi:hypothetical protein
MEKPVLSHHYTEKRFMPALRFYLFGRESMQKRRDAQVPWNAPNVVPM